MAFAFLMEAKLEQNKHKGGWQHEPPSWLLRRLHAETNELKRATLSDLEGNEWRIKIADEAADVANFAMMIVDVCGWPEPRADALLKALDEKKES